MGYQNPTVSSTTPSISVIIPVYNGERYLAEAVASIRAQKYAPLEIIIVDDGSTDGTATLTRSLGADIRYFYQANAGPAAARNLGIGAAGGDLIAFLDSDDLWPPGKLALQVDCLQQNRQLEVVLGRVQCFGMLEEVEKRLNFLEPDHKIISVNLGSGVFRKTAFERVGFFDESLRYNEDSDWFLCAREQGIAMLILKEVTLLFRIHPDSMTHHKPAADSTLFEALKKSLDRRRRQGLLDYKLPCLSDFDEGKR